MCGICGFISYRSPLPEDAPSILRRMNQTLAHRGPDAGNILIWDNVALGFNRLSIIGLENGMQPISNEDESIVLICNGEIFNYIELKKQLSARGHIFSTASDVEVIIHLYEEKGLDFLNDLNGQFAFVLMDKRRKRLLCARDQMGIIPFFYTKVNDVFVFGSEIKAILAHSLVKPEVDLVGLDQVFTFPGLISPRTMFRNIHSLENGHYLLINEEGNLVNRQYWDLEYPDGDVVMNGKPESYYVEKLEELLENSIRLRLRADVPSGIYLSGGLDSSIIAMKIHQLAPEMQQEAFSIDFVDAGISESFYQQLIADSCGAVFNRKVFFYDDISERLRQSVYHSECPVKETYNTASMSLSGAVNAKGLKVILSGEGSDELFAGYIGYRFDVMKAAYGTAQEVDPLEQAIRNTVWGDPHFFYECDFLPLNSLKKRLYAPSISACFEEFNCLNHYVIDKSKIAGRSTINKRSYIDFKTRLVDHLVSDHGDRMALANGVEVRYPFLDKELVEFSTKVPASLKVNGMIEKYILKRMARTFVPSQVVDREKFGFVAPGSPYLLQKNVEYINDLLSFETIKRQGFFNPEEIEKLKKQYATEGFSINVPFESDLLITVITFGILLDTFFNK